MIKIDGDLDIDFSTLPDNQDLLEKDSSQKKLFSCIHECLNNNGIKSGYTLGYLGGNEEYSLFKRSGYWIVAFSERGRHDAIAVFMDFHDATEFFLGKMLDLSNKYFDWEKVFN
ncbi:hypothetical protein C8E02_0137 [Vogesella indigofera]|uniref:Uncharacterized protein n=1 Tax=Vogesella indigofera TaxID=45465 RepID=A0A495BQB1_VOGIN|nr:hypothetical protein [Vogesella indigofera]RKQ63120.1 hypothetical protein C8E02_0137 [Vogesella indigofera]